MNRKEILEQLARSEIDKEEAERLIAELGEPLPEASAPPPTAPRKQGVSLGCLVALIIGLVLLTLTPILLFFSFFALRSAPGPDFHLETLDGVAEPDFHYEILQERSEEPPSSKSPVTQDAVETEKDPD